jgi:hypothetical protein
MTAASDDRQRRDARIVSTGRTARANATARSLLDDALVRTVYDRSVADARSDDLEPLRAVARRLGPTPFGYSPVAVELVAASLHEQFREIQRTESGWQALVGTVAQTLYDDPPSRTRLAALWQGLTVTAP